MLTPLTEEILTYKESGEGLSSIIEKISVIVYRYPKKLLHWDEDDCSEFFCVFFPKIPKLIVNFTYVDKPFEAYLTVSLKYQIQSYLCRKRRRLLERRISGYEEFLSQDKTSNVWIREPAPPAFNKKFIKPLHINAGNVIGPGNMRKRFLYLSLTGAYFMSGRMIESIAALIQCDMLWLLCRIDELKELMKRHYGRYDRLLRRRNWYFFLIFRVHEELKEEYDAEKRGVLFANLKEYKMRMDIALKAVHRIPLTPTHQEIAKVLGVPKGSVDSGIHYLKNTLSRVI